MPALPTAENALSTARHRVRARLVRRGRPGAHGPDADHGVLVPQEEIVRELPEDPNALDRPQAAGVFDKSARLVWRVRAAAWVEMALWPQIVVDRSGPRGQAVQIALASLAGRAQPPQEGSQALPWQVLVLRPAGLRLRAPVALARCESESADVEESGGAARPPPPQQAGPRELCARQTPWLPPVFREGLEPSRS